MKPDRRTDPPRQTRNGRKSSPEPGRPVTMSDVAAAAGVAQSTVSRILNDAPAPISVSAETRERVRSIARELGYRPHPIARALRGAPTMLLGAIVRDITDPFFAGAIEALTIECKTRGYSVVLGHARATEDEALVMTAVLEARQCDAIVLFGDFTAEHRLVEDLRNGNARVVGLWHGSERDRPFPTVGVDNRAGVRLALAHLAALGHERIAYVGAESLGDMRDRFGAYVEFMQEHAAPLPPGYVQMVPNRVGSGDLALAPILEQTPPPTAILTATDTLAIGLLHAASERHVQIPDQLSVVSFDDIPMASVSIPALTTVRMPIAAIVQKGVELCIGADAWTGQGLPPQEVFQPELVIRSSTAPAADGSSRD
jgi:DNA-binding LacI/PurR family transcriptional regulator